MDSSALGAVFLSASLQVLFDRLVPSREFISRLASREFINFFWGRKQDEVKQLVNNAEFNHTNTATGDCVIELENASEATSSSTAQTFGQQKKLTQITMYSKDRVACTVGPFGGQGGNIWDDGIHTTIRQIKLHHGSRINSIKIEYDQNGESKWSDLRGKGDGGDGVEITIKLNFPSEFLWSISGYYITTGDSNTAVVSSLTIRSNRKVYGPYGKEEGEPFSASSTSGKITGLFGISDTYINSIGYYTEPHPSISMGPFGGFGGQQWNDGTYTTIRQIIISHGDVLIDSIQIEYDLDGQSTWSDKHGESVGGKQAVVTLDYPREFLINISGYFSDYSSGRGPVVVRSLTIESNKQKYGPFGSEQGKHFSTRLTGGKITGFHGRCGSFLDSIAAYFEANDQFLSFGPFGGLGGNQWDDGTYTGIREIYIHHGVVIDSIQMKYDKDGQSIISDLRGGPGGNLVEVKLDYPNEYIISISGYVYTKEGSITVIQSLIIQSNKKQYGPYGGEEGKYFSTSSTGGKIIGFYGRCGRYLDSIGAYYEPL